jgi:nucleotide-binding universal stress UspA family protein
MYKHIMLPVDGSDLSLKAEKECIAFAKSIGAKVTVIHVLPHFNLHVSAYSAPKAMITKIEDEHDEETKQVVQTMLAEVEKRIKADGIKCDSLLVVADNPYEAIIEKAGASGCDLIMMASHGRKGVNAVLLGSETVKVLTHTKIPVLVVR